MSDPNEAAIKRVLDLCEFWDTLTKTESPTTSQIREALGPEAIERALNPMKTVDLDGSPVDFHTEPIIYGEPCD